MQRQPGIVLLASLKNPSDNDFSTSSIAPAIKLYSSFTVPFFKVLNINDIASLKMLVALHFSRYPVNFILL